MSGLNMDIGDYLECKQWPFQSWYRFPWFWVALRSPIQDALLHLPFFFLIQFNLKSMEIFRVDSIWDCSKNLDVFSLEFADRILGTELVYLCSSSFFLLSYSSKRLTILLPFFVSLSVEFFEWVPSLCSVEWIFLAVNNLQNEQWNE